MEGATKRTRKKNELTRKKKIPSPMKIPIYGYYVRWFSHFNAHSYDWWHRRVTNLNSTGHCGWNCFGPASRIKIMFWPHQSNLGPSFHLSANRKLKRDHQPVPKRVRNSPTIPSISCPSWSQVASRRSKSHSDQRWPWFSGRPRP